MHYRPSQILSALVAGYVVLCCTLLVIVSVPPTMESKPSFMRTFLKYLDKPDTPSILQNFREEQALTLQLERDQQHAKKKRRRKDPWTMESAFNLWNSDPSVTAVMVSMAQQPQWRPNLNSIGSSSHIRKYQQTKKAVLNAISWEQNGYTVPFSYYTRLPNKSWNVCTCVISVYRQHNMFVLRVQRRNLPQLCYYFPENSPYERMCGHIVKIEQEGRRKKKTDFAVVLHWPEGEHQLEEKVNPDWSNVKSSRVPLNKALEYGDIQLIDQKEETEMLTPTFYAIAWILGTARSEWFVHPASPGYDSMPSSRRDYPLQFANTSRAGEYDSRRIQRFGWYRDPVSKRIKMFRRGDCFELQSGELIMISAIEFRAPSSRSRFSSTLQKVRYMELSHLHSIISYNGAQVLLYNVEQQYGAATAFNTRLLLVDKRSESPSRSWNVINIKQKVNVVDAALAQNRGVDDEHYIFCGVVEGSDVFSYVCKEQSLQQLLRLWQDEDWSLDPRLQEEDYELLPFMYWKDGHEIGSHGDGLS